MENKEAISVSASTSRPNYTLILFGVLALVFSPTVLVLVLNNMIH